MKHCAHRRRHAVLIALCLLGVMVAFGGIWLRAQQCQYALNRQLIVALKQENDRRALVLVNAGADPNTPVELPPILSLWETLKQTFHRSTPSVIQKPTAFTLACGVRYFWWEGDKKVIVQCPNNVDLVQAMIAHGAQINSHDNDGHTPLMYVTSGGDADAKIVRYLIKNGADVNAHDVEGETALHWMIHPSETRADIVKILLAAGADPNLADNAGITPLMDAKEYKQPEIIALLKRYGATEHKHL